MSMFNYERKNLKNRTNNQVDLGQAGSFLEVKYDNNEPEEESISGISFSSFHCMKTVSDYRVFTALKSPDMPSVLYIIWRDFPFLKHLEEGGDLMLQELKKDKELNHLLIDNTFVQSGWMKDDVVEYLNNAWYPGLIEVGLKRFAHLQAESALGASSFKKFEESVNSIIGDMARGMKRPPFEYFPVKTSEINKDGQAVKTDLRATALEKGLAFLNQ
jgi:hypothetical protein